MQITAWRSIAMSKQILIAHNGCQLTLVPLSAEADDPILYPV